MPSWKRYTVFGALALILLGACLQLVEATGSNEAPKSDHVASSDDGATDRTDGRTALPSTGLLPGGTPAPDTRAPETTPASDSEGGEAAYSLGFLKMGFSFFVGFSLGYALRKFLQIALFGAGVFFALMFVLSYAEFVVVQWQVIDLAFQSMVDNLGSQLTHARAFVTGALPQAGLASLGLVAGYRRN